MDDNMLQAIQKMGIFELRTFAREMGVSSPTTLKRQQLIEAITEISNGEKQAVKGVTRGRKPKKVESVSNLLHKYMDNNEEYSDASYNLSKYGIQTHFRVSVPPQVYVNDFSSYKGTRYMKEGVVEVLANGVGEIKLADQKIFVPKNLIEQYAIENGQNIKVFCAEIPEQENCFITTEINENSIINRNQNYNNLESISKTKKLQFDVSLPALEEFFSDNSVRAGQCVLVTYEQKVNPEIIVSELTSSIKNLDMKKIALFSNQLENAHLKKHFHHFNTMSMLDNTIHRLRNIELAIDSAKRYAEEGEDVIVLLGNLDNVFTTYKQLFIANENSEYVATESAIQNTVSLLASAKQTIKGSVTIIAIAQKEEEYLKKYMSHFSAFINFEKGKNNQLKLNDSFSIYE